MKLFTKADNAKLFANYSKGSNMADQNVVVKIFNPYGNGRWYIMNSDPNDPDYLWGIVDLGYGAEVGSISRNDLENYRNRMGLGFERDMSFRPKNAKMVLEGLRNGEFFAGGGNLSRDRRYVNYGEDYEVRYSKGKSRHGYGNLKFDGGGEVEFIDYGDSEIMFEPNSKKYYANEIEFDNLEDAKKFIDSGEVPYFIKDAYSKGMFKKGGRLLSTKERYIAELKGLTGLQQKAIEDYIDENNLTTDEVLRIVIGLGRKQISGSDVSTAIVGKKNNSESKKLLAFAMSDEALKAEYGAFMDGYNLKDINGKKIEVGDIVKTTQPSGGLLLPADSEVGVVEKTKDAFGNESLQIRYRKKGTNYDRFILLNGKDNEIVKKAYQNGGFMDGVYAGGGMVVTSVKDIPNFKQRLDEGKITYRGLGMGKVFNDFYEKAGESGTRIKVDGKEYFITDTEFDSFSRGADGKMRIKFDAPQRKG